MLHRIDDRDAAAYAGLERNFLARLIRQAHDFFAVGGHKRLVGRDHMLAGAQSAAHHVARDRRAADELDDDVDVGVV